MKFKFINIGLCFLLSACQVYPSISNQSSPVVNVDTETVSQNAAWHLKSATIDGKKLNNVAMISIDFDKANVFGYSGVNQYSSRASRFANKINIDKNINITRMAGDIAAMQTESQYLSALRRVNKYKQDKNTLELSGDGVELIFIK